MSSQEFEKKYPIPDAAFYAVGSQIQGRLEIVMKRSADDVRLKIFDNRGDGREHLIAEIPMLWQEMVDFTHP